MLPVTAPGEDVVGADVIMNTESDLLEIGPCAFGDRKWLIKRGGIHILLDKEARTWREMTEQELERDRCAWDADREQLKRECREYREG